MAGPLYTNFMSGALDVAVGDASTTSLSSPAFADLPVVTGGDWLWITLDPTAVDGAPELVKVTAHSASATTVTVERAQQGTTGRPHLSGTTWDHAWTKTDAELANRRTGCTVTRSTVQSIPSGGTGTQISFTAETFDSDGFITTPAATVYVPTGLGGLYAVTAKITMGSIAYTGFIVVDGIVYPIPLVGFGPHYPQGANAGTIIVPAEAGDSIGLYVYHTVGSPQDVSAATLHVYRIGA